MASVEKAISGKPTSGKPTSGCHHISNGEKCKRKSSDRYCWQHVKVHPVQGFPSEPRSTREILQEESRTEAPSKTIKRVKKMHFLEAEPTLETGSAKKSTSFVVRKQVEEKPIVKKSEVSEERKPSKAPISEELSFEQLIENGIDSTMAITDIVLKEQAKCQHLEFYNAEAEGIFVCRNCGCQVEKFDFKAEWHHYGASDNRSGKDGSRCHRSKEVLKGGIEKVFQEKKLTIPEKIRKEAEYLYQKIVGGATVRGVGRTSRVAACLLYAYRHNGIVKTSDYIRSLFGIKKTQMSEGIAQYLNAFPEDRTLITTHIDLLQDFAKKINLKSEHWGKVFYIAKFLDHRSETINHSIPQSVAAATLYLYLCLTPDVKKELGMTKAKFSKIVELSEITITKLLNHIEELLGKKFIS
jgi:transcription initiation factor TFIIIB Brf1 subunit/transcription initiation factor TFIIB